MDAIQIKKIGFKNWVDRENNTHAVNNSRTDVLSCTFAAKNKRIEVWVIYTVYNRV